MRPLARLLAICLCSLPSLRAQQTSLRITGDERLRTVLLEWDATFEREHPGAHVALTTTPAPAVAQALTAGTADVIVLGRSLWEVERRPFRFVHGTLPIGVRAGTLRGAPAAAAGTREPGLYVARRAPLTALSVADAGRLFGAGDPALDLTEWQQLIPGAALPAAWQGRVVHLYGLHDDGAWATHLREVLLNGRTFADRYEALPSESAVLEAVAADPFGIALLGESNEAVPAYVRVLPLTGKTGQAVAPGKPGYPLAEPVMLYRNPKAPQDSLAAAYLKYVITPAAQAVLARSSVAVSLAASAPPR